MTALGKMMTRAQTWRAGCLCFDCHGGRDRHQQRRLEERQWRRDQDEPDPERTRQGEVCPCPCHKDPDHCAICDNDYADLCSPIEEETRG